MPDSLRPHEPQHARPSHPSPTPGVHPNPCPLSRWSHPTISSSVIPFSSCPQSFPPSASFPVSQLFTSGGQSIGVSASASVPSMNTQDWSPLGWTGWISLQSKGLSRVFSNTMNQGKLEVVKQEMARVNIDILGISELKWTGMDLIPMTIVCRQESLRRNEVALIVNNIVQNAVLGCNLKMRMISVHFQDKLFNITVIQVYAPTTNAEEAELFYEVPIRLSRTNTKKRCPFQHRGLECKSRKSRDT